MEGVLGTWEWTEWPPHPRAPYTFCSTKQVFSTLSTCPLFPVHQAHKCAQEPYSVGLIFFRGMLRSPPQGLEPGLLGTGP